MMTGPGQPPSASAASSPKPPAIGLPGAQAIPGQTPIDPDEAEGLIPTHLTTQTELNDWEFGNILSAINWAFTPRHRRRRRREVCTTRFLRQLHAQMFSQTWTWAGKYRNTDKSIGIAYFEIAAALENLCKDAACWWATTQPSRADLARFHHRLVAIHPFANGNGRHARLATDVVSWTYGIAEPTWGARAYGGSLTPATPARAAYLSALREADRGVFGPLTAFIDT